MDGGHRLGLVLLYAVMATYALLMVRMLVQILFGSAIENHLRRQWRRKHAGAAYPFRSFSGKQGWANARLTKDVDPNQPAPDAKAASSVTRFALSLGQSIALVSIVIAGLASTGMAQQPGSPQPSAAVLKQQLLDIELKETSLRIRLEEIDEQLKPESIERELAGVGSVHPEELREHRRKLLTIERNGLRTQLDLLEEQRARIAAEIAEAETATNLRYAQPSPTPLPKRMTEMAMGNFGSVNLLSRKSVVAMAMMPFIAGGLALLLIVGFRRIWRWQSALLIVLFAQLFLPVHAQSQAQESIRAFAKGHGSIVSTMEERSFSAVLVVLRPNGEAVITLFSDLQLQAQGTWSANASSPDEIQLKITGGELNGNISGTGKLLLIDDRTSLKELTIKGKTFDGREMTLKFTAEASEPPQTAHINLISFPGLP
ncbi:MAG TPA: hypothetical protein VN476_07915 [Pyrinomonadaceae bacterium]|nr:hypothetical protein [Pyrinomonadaceae bacterium]